MSSNQTSESDDPGDLITVDYSTTWDHTRDGAWSQVRGDVSSDIIDIVERTLFLDEIKYGPWQVLCSISDGLRYEKD